MVRTNTKIGDVFSVDIDKEYKKYFQLISFDLTQLNSDVIRAFKDKYSLDANPVLSDIVNGEVEFYAHCITKLGVKLGYWKKIGNVMNVGDTKSILFRNTSDYGSMSGELITVSQNWYVWNINDEKTRKVGKLTGENRTAEIGIVFSPDKIVHRIRTGVHGIVYPEYE